jgi:hypothetical protein
VHFDYLRLRPRIIGKPKKYCENCRRANPPPPPPECNEIEANPSKDRTVHGWIILRFEMNL